MHARNAADVADHFVAVVFSHIDREYPNKLDHVINDATQVQGPRALHPIFYGSFDWHSCVHGHWLLIRALRLYPHLAQRTEVIELLNGKYTADAVQVETDYLKQPLRATFERTYGWAWLVKLAAELKAGLAKDGGAGMNAETSAAFTKWDGTLAPLTNAFVDRYFKYLPKATYPIRVGTHQNTAFGLALANDYARATQNSALTELIATTARNWYVTDFAYPAWEPDGSDFLSPGLMEAECMRRVLPAVDFLPWFNRFFPELAQGEPATLFKPAFVSDRTDGQITHLDGLNLSRAWCWRTLAGALPESDPRRALMLEASKTHLDAALPHVTGDYMGEHWLATFAMLALTE
ncbi:MAG: DUF2891 domain-containing protein [Phycisphaerales bacterium]